MALGVFMTIGFALQLWGGPFQKRYVAILFGNIQTPPGPRLSLTGAPLLEPGLCLTQALRLGSQDTMGHLLVRTDHFPFLVSLLRLPEVQLQFRQPWTPSPDPMLQSCPPRQHLVFLKTHKSGSSSVLSLLHRYGDQHGLRFALPTRYQFGYPRLFQASWVKGYQPEDGGTQVPFHILCHHMRFNLKEVRAGRKAQKLSGKCRGCSLHD